MEERRFYSRVKTDKKVICRINKESEVARRDSLAVTDISPAGLCFISGEEISKDTVLKLQMSFPCVYPPDPELYNSVKVAHCDKDINSNKFKIGGYYIHPNKRGFDGR